MREITINDLRDRIRQINVDISTQLKNMESGESMLRDRITAIKSELVDAENYLGELLEKKEHFITMRRRLYDTLAQIPEESQPWQSQTTGDIDTTPAQIEKSGTSTIPALPDPIGEETT